jgi:hypothetical protein
MKQRLVVLISAEEKRNLEKLAKDRGESVSVVARAMIRDAMRGAAAAETVK